MLHLGMKLIVLHNSHTQIQYQINLQNNNNKKKKDTALVFNAVESKTKTQYYTTNQMSVADLPPPPTATPTPIPRRDRHGENRGTSCLWQKKEEVFCQLRETKGQIKHKTLVGRRKASAHITPVTTTTATTYYY